MSALKQKASQTYVLIHGAWHGSWCWKRVALHLRLLGHTVLTPDLPGHGKNRRVFEQIHLADYVREIEGFVRASPHPVVLVGHSMAGVVATQVAENMPHKIDRLIYVSAYIPPNGGSLAEEERTASAPTLSSFIRINTTEKSISLEACAESLKALFYGQCCEADVMYALRRLQKQPLNPFLDTVSLTSKGFGKIPKLYIECLQDQAILIQDQRRMHQRAGCRVMSLNTDHSPFFSSDGALVQMLCEA
jgi:pimeloyl-ACP methyl ester carboxylesterase